MILTLGGPEAFFFLPEIAAAAAEARSRAVTQSCFGQLGGCA